jgi:hypothetical protein
MPLVIAEIKRRGKKLIGILAMKKYIKINSIVFFGWECDFAIDLKENGTVRSKVVVMNEYYGLNQINIYKIWQF